MERQNSTSIGTDHSGAAVRTINNILTGITHSVNRLAKFHEIKEDKTNKKFINKGTLKNEAGFDYEGNQPNLVHQEKHNAIEFQEHNTSSQMIGVQNVILDKLTDSNVKAKPKWSRHISAKTQASKFQALPRQIKTTLKHMENTSKIHAMRAATVPENDLQSVLQPRKRRRPLKQFKQVSKSSLSQKISEPLTGIQPDKLTSSNLVELYHNIAVKSSDSDSALCSKSVIRQKGGGDLLVPPNHVPSISVHPTITEIIPMKPLCKQQQLTTIKENGFSDIDGLVNECSLNIIKNYELPTIASRMKQVNKQFLSSFSFRSIPFCPAKSISPSHNIGLNIQQVMNILKTRQPIAGISPTLAHNIGLAAGKFENRHLSTLVSTLSSRLGYGKLQCPLLKIPINYHPEQSIDKGIPEEQIELINDYNVNNFNTNGPSGDREVPLCLGNSPHAVWSIDPEVDKRCTCAPQRGYLSNRCYVKLQATSEITSIQSKPINGPRLVVPKLTRSNKGFTPKKQRIRNWIKNDIQRSITAESVKTTQDFNGKEKTLKMVLKNLHDEFELLNMKYEELAKELENSEDPKEEASKELETIETELNKKEKEINMVMSLYKEVLALKDQVKKLRTKTSQPSVVATNHASVSEFKEPKAAQHLTQLLKQIQKYQMHYKK